MSIRIKEIRELLNLKQKELAEILNATQGVVSGIERGSKNLSRSMIENLIKKYPNVNVNWLFTGIGSPFFKETSQKAEDIGTLINEKFDDIIPKSVLEPRIQKIESQLTELIQLSRELSPPVLSEHPQESSPAQERKVPYFGKVAAGNPIAIQSHPDKMISVPARFLKNSGEYYVVKASGQSMTDAGISSGSLCLIKKTSEKREGVILLVRYENESTLKRYSKNYKTGEDRLCYENGSGHCITPKPGSWEVQGELVTVL